ncbi:MAG: DUF2442 domain-containing protein [Chloroflexi bacterium]|nr:DUF2442 domain-containing protein [Chloroflexota bacterium]
METQTRVVAESVVIADGIIHITLTDGRVFKMPLDYFPWLKNATPEQQAHYQADFIAILWPDLDDGIDMEALVNNRWIRPVEYLP